MRILGFQKHWLKLDKEKFTTFRFERRDKDWQINEVVQIVVKPRSKNREIVGPARIVGKELRLMPAGNGNQPSIPRITEEEAIEDGFASLFDMKEWMKTVHGIARLTGPINKLMVKYET